MVFVMRVSILGLRGVTSVVRASSVCCLGVRHYQSCQDPSVSMHTNHTIRIVCDAMPLISSLFQERDHRLHFLVTRTQSGLFSINEPRH